MIMFLRCFARDTLKICFPLIGCKLKVRFFPVRFMISKSKTIDVPPFTNLKDFSKLIGVNPKVLFQKHLKGFRKRKHFYFRHKGNLHEFKSPHSTIIPYEIAEDLGKSLGRKVFLREIEPNPHYFEEISVEKDKDVLYFQKWPSIVLLGHYDHGKTTLLDKILHSKVPITSKEPYGITQEIRARTVPLSDKWTSTVLDTPGQEIFYRMRTEGSSAADLGVLVVDVNEGVKAQTGESIGAAEAANLPVLVALNKIDLCRDPSRIKDVEDELRKFLVLEQATMVPISALTGEGIGNLKQAIIAQLEALSERVNFLTTGGDGYGTVLDYAQDHRKGQRYLLLIHSGVVRNGDWFVCGLHWGKIRALQQTTGEPVQEAKGGMAVIAGLTEKSGLSEVPLTQPLFILPQKVAEEVAKVRYQSLLFQESFVPLEQAEKLFPTNKMKQGIEEGTLIENGDFENEYFVETEEQPVIPVVLKADKARSLETVMDALDDHYPHIKVVKASIGKVTMHDVSMAQAAECPIFMFNVKPDVSVKKEEEAGLVKLVAQGTLQGLVDEIEKWQDERVT